MTTIVSSLIEGIKDEKIKTVVSERYFGGENGKLKPWKLIAKQAGISIQGAINLHNAALETLKRRIENEKAFIPSAS